MTLLSFNPSSERASPPCSSGIRLQRSIALESAVLLQLEYEFCNAFFHCGDNDGQQNLLKKLGELDTSDPDHFFRWSLQGSQVAGSKEI